MKTCDFCGIDISHKHAGAKFCSHGCYSESKITQVICTCEFCGIEYTRPANQANRKYCSRECSNEGITKVVTYICDVCNKSFDVRPSSIRKADKRGTEIRFCSMDCRSEGFSEEGNPTYKGGCINKDGYHVIQKSGKQYLLHRIIMEEHLGRELTPDDCVHHINNIRDDNRIENLQLMTKSEHCSLHEIWSLT